MIKYLFFTFFFTFFSIFCFSDIYLDCKNPEKLGYKKDFYLLKINDRFKQGSYLEEGTFKVTRIIHFRDPDTIGIFEYGTDQILRSETKYSIMSEGKFEIFDDFWQIDRSNLKLEITRKSPYKEFNGKCKVINAQRFEKIKIKYSSEQEKLQKKYEEKLLKDRKI